MKIKVKIIFDLKLSKNYLKLEYTLLTSRKLRIVPCDGLIWQRLNLKLHPYPSATGIHAHLIVCLQLKNYLII